MIFSITLRNITAIVVACWAIVTSVDAANNDFYTTRVSSEVSAYPVRVSVAGMFDGGYIMTYSINSDATRSYFQRFDANMLPTSSETMFATGAFTGANGTDVPVAALSSGGFAVAVENQGAFIYSLSNTLVQKVSIDCLASPNLAPRLDGSFVMAWRCGGSSYFQQFDGLGNGLGDPVQITTDLYGGGSMGGAPRLAILLDQSIVVVWDEVSLDDAGFQTNVMARRFATNHTPITEKYKINTSKADGLSAITSLRGGGFVVAWVSSQQIIAAQFDAQGLPVGFENTITSSTLTDWLPAITGTPDGGYVLAWQYSFTDASDNFQRNQYFIRYDAANTRIGNEQSFNGFGSMCTGCPSYGDYPAIAVSPSGRVVVIWVSHDGISGRVVFAAQSMFDGNSVTLQPAPQNVTLMSGYDLASKSSSLLISASILGFKSAGNLVLLNVFFNFSIFSVFIILLIFYVSIRKYLKAFVKLRLLL